MAPSSVPLVPRTNSSSPASSTLDVESVMASTYNNGGPPQRKKSSLRTRWLVLVLVCTVMTGSYYTYDIPAALHQQLQDYMPPSSNYEYHFNLLYAVYSVPNVVLPFFGGTFVDCHGAPLCLTVFSLLVFLGAAILSVGVANRSWEFMYLGRFVFGIGMESVCVAQSTVLSDWFEGREVALAMGIRRGISVLGKVWNNIMSPVVANSGSSGGIEASFLIGTVLTCCGVVASGVILLVDNMAVKKLKRMAADDSLTAALLEYDDGCLSTEANRLSGSIIKEDNPQDGGVLDQSKTSKKKKVRITDIRNFNPLFWLLAISCFIVYGCILPFNNVASGILLERNLFTSSPADCALEHPGQCSAGYLQPETNGAFRADGDVCAVAPAQAPVLPSSVNHTRGDSSRSDAWHEPMYVHDPLAPDRVDCGDDFWRDGCASDYCAKQNAATERAGKVMSIPFLVSALMSPLLGHLVDRVGRRAQIIVFSSAALFFVHLALAVSAASPIVPLIFQGIAYALFSAVIWPSVSLTVPKQNTGTAFGVVTSIQNVGMATFPIIIAAIHNASGGRYIPNVEFFFMGCAAGGVVLGAFMNLLDRRYGSKLNKVHLEEEETVDGIRKDGDGKFAAVEDDESYYSPLLHSEEGLIT